MRLLLLSLLIATTASAQRMMDEPPKSRGQEGVKEVSFEPVVLFETDSTYTLNVHYRIQESFFVFVKPDSVGAANKFYGNGELLIEIFSLKDEVEGREVKKIELERPSMPEGESNTTIEGAFSIPIPSGEHKVILRIDDSESKRTVSETKKLVISKIASPTLSITKPFFVQPVVPRTTGTQDVSIVPLNTGGAVFLGTSGGVLVQCLTQQPAIPIEVRWKIKATHNFPAAGTINYEGTEFTLMPGAPVSFKNNVAYSIVPTKNQFVTLYLPLPMQKFETGKYEGSVTVTQGKETCEEKFIFATVWQRMPASLRNPEEAVAALQHIVPETTLDSIKSLSESMRIQAFADYWKAQDPDTSTAFNERMAEYYRRVDIAQRLYASQRSPDGYKTDCGKVYILYGSPTTTFRKLQPGTGLLEVWVYEKLGLKFIFADPKKTGILSLMETSPL